VRRCLRGEELRSSIEGEMNYSAAELKKKVGQA
jgi:hypothetical protein